MQALILAGGRGTRLLPLTGKIPKNVLPLFQMPFLEHPLRRLRRAGVRDVVLAAGYHASLLRRFLGSGRKLGLRLHYQVERRPLGTAGAVKFAQQRLKGESFFVLNGDILTDVDFENLRRFHEKKKALLTLTVRRVENPRPFGVVVLDRKGRVRRFVEKPETPPAFTINAGIYVFHRNVLQKIPAGRAVSSETELFPRLLKEGGKLFGWMHRGYWNDIGRPQQYLEAHWDILEGKIAFPRKKLVGRIRRNKNGKPCFLAKGARLAAKVRLGAGTIVYPGVTIAQGSRVVSSLLLPGCRVGRFVDMQGTLLGRNVHVPDFSRVAPGTVWGPA